MNSRYLKRLARDTWNDVTWIHRMQHQFSLGEETITEGLLRRINIRYPSIAVRAFNKRQEGRNGADLEWWIGSPNSGWVCLMIQAKKLELASIADGSYQHLWRTVGKTGRLQVDVLLAEANSKHAFPLHLFYNGWEPGQMGRGVAVWPAPKQHYGCALAFTTHVKALDDGMRTARLSALSSIMFPWHQILDLRSGPGGLPRRGPRKGPPAPSAHTILNLLRSAESVGSAPAVRSVHAQLPYYLEAPESRVNSRKAGLQYFDSGGDLGPEPDYAIIQNLERLT